MPSAQVLKFRPPRTTATLMHGAAELQAIFAELTTYMEAVPALREEFRARFQGDETLAMVTKAPVDDGVFIMSMAPTAELLAWRSRCRRLARARGLEISPPPRDALATVEMALLRLMDQCGPGASLADAARALGLPLVAHDHPMGQGQGTL